MSVAERTLLVLLAVAAIWRVTRLLITDEFPPARVVRDWHIRTFGVVNVDGSLLGGKRWGMLGFSIAYLWTCPWCMSVWVGAGLWGLMEWLTPTIELPYPLFVIAAGSLVAGIAGAVESAHEQRYKIRERELDDRRPR